MVFGETMMGDEAAKAVPPLAMVEKRQAPRPKGGCVGILFQLFDWQRRFAKKKLFSRKLLPPARPKPATRNFKGDEKMPIAKLHYIADENEGGFPNLRETKSIDVERKHDMGTPGLVARLMGLESMPSVHREKLKNASSSKNNDDKVRKSVVTDQGLGREEMNLDKGQMRHERPQKLQKTGLSERQAIARFGAEALQIKGVLSHCRKRNPPKLESHMKGPSISSSKSVSHKSRLIGVATRILEPGLQARNRERCALTYSESAHHVPGYEVTVESSAVEKTPYINCSPVLHKSNASQYLDDQRMECTPASSSSGFSSDSYQDSVSRKMNPTVPVVDTEKLFSKMRQEESISLKDGKRFPSVCQKPWHLPTKKSSLLRDEPSSVATLKSRRASSAASSVSGTKDFVALNRSLSGQTRPRVLSKAECSSLDATRISRGRRDGSVSHLRSPVRRMRPVSSNEPVRCINSRNSVTGKQKKVTSVTVTGNGQTSDKGSVISFSFNSPLKQNTSYSTETEYRRLNKSCSVHESDDSGKNVLVGSNRKASFRDHLAVSGDALGALLEQKLKELISQEDDDSTSGSTTPKRPTCMILQELIAALTADPTLSRDCDVLDTNKAFQVKSRKEGSLIELPSDTNHFSPGSVLDASFSNDSCVSSSLDDRSGINSLIDFMDFSWDLPQQLEPDSDLSDSAIKLENDRAHPDIMINLISCISRELGQLNLDGIRLSGSKLSYAKEVFLHSEMLFSGTTCLSWSGTENTIISPLLNELESLAISAWTYTGWFDGLVDLKEGKQFKEFLFDCLLECLELKYHPCSNFGYQGWRRLLSRLNEKILVRDVEEELKMWTALSGMSVDEMIEWEMSHSLGKWVDFDIEAFENGCKIERDILQSMMEEIVDDILLCS